MHILLLGGSNAGVKDGWAVQLADLAVEHRVENRFLGAVGSLYGLMALMKLERENAPLPDLVIFEYCLNDILLLEAGVLRPALVTDALAAVADFCARKGVRLFYLNLKPRPSGNARQKKAIERIEKLYAAAAHSRGAPCLWLREVFSEGLAAAHFQDENHLSTEAAGRVARALLASIESGVPAPRPRKAQAPRFDYVDATQPLVLGPCSRRMLASRVFDGPFLEIARGGKSYWRGEGSLAALMLQSTEASGAYCIRTRGCAVRKTPCSQMQEIVRNLMLLHYVARSIRAEGDVEISMPEDEEGLMSLPADKGLLEAPARVPYVAQTLSIHGVIFWRDRSIGARLRGWIAKLAR